MKKNSRRGTRHIPLIRYLLLACLLLGPVLAASAADEVSLDLVLRRITEARKPFLVGDALILTAMPDGGARFVGARFDFRGARPAERESYRVLHTFSRNESGVFVLDTPVPEGVKEIRYRIVVDGAWTRDPNNPVMESDELGNVISLVTLEQEPRRPLVNPKAEEGGRLTLEFHGDPGARVTVAGDFNNWDPFVDALREGEPGVYRITLRVGRGAHFYYFFSAGRRVLDPHRHRVKMAPDKSRVLIVERDVYFRSRPSNLLCGRNERHPSPDCVAEGCTQLRVQNGRGVLQFASGAHDRGLSVAFHLLG